MKLAVPPNSAEHKSSDIEVGKDLPTEELAVSLLLLGYPSNKYLPPLLRTPVKQLRIW